MYDRAPTGHNGLYLMLHEMCGVNLKEPGMKVQHQLLQVVRFAHGSDAVVNNLGIAGRRMQQ